MNRFPPILLLLFATVLWGGNFVIGRAVIEELPPVTLGFFRWCAAFIIFLPFAWSTLKRDWSIIRKHLVIIFLLALTGVGAYSVLVYIALHHTTSINASLMNTGAPIIIYLLSFIFLKERLTVLQIIGTVISISGVLFIISNGSLATILNVQFNTGDLIVMIAVLSWAIYSILTRQYSQKLPGQSTFLISIFFGIIILLPFFIYERATTTFETTWSFASISAILYTGIFASILAYIFWNNGVAKLGANHAGIFMNFIPVFATIFAIIFIGETLQFYQVVGGLLVVFGVYLTTRTRQAEKVSDLKRNIV